MNMDKKIGETPFGAQKWYEADLHGRHLRPIPLQREKRRTKKNIRTRYDAKQIRIDRGNINNIQTYIGLIQQNTPCCNSLLMHP